MTTGVPSSLSRAVDGSAAGQIAPSTARARAAGQGLAAADDRPHPAARGRRPAVVWLASEAPPLIAAILAALADPELGRARAADRARAARLARLRAGPGAPAQIPRDLAALQACWSRRCGASCPSASPATSRARSSGWPRSSARSRARSPASWSRSARAARPTDPVTGLPGPAQLDDWLRILLAEQRRYGHGFALALVDVDGLGRINDAYGREAGDRMLAAVAAILRRQLRDVDQAFRLEEDEFAIVAPAHRRRGPGGDGDAGSPS